MKQLSSLILAIVMICSITGNLKSGIDPQQPKAFFDFKKQSSPELQLIFDRKKIDVNRISAWFRNDGEFFSDHATTGPGFEWPKGSRIHAIFSSGLWVGAKVQTDTGKEIRVATVGHFGSEYRPGRIMPDGSAEDFTLPHLRIYQVRPLLDLPTSTPDYADWPVNQGAPWIDIDANGIWNPNIDKIGINWPSGPEYPAMIQFYVYNDAHANFHTWIWGRSKPLGVEVRQTNWAYQSGIGDILFIRFQIYNKSSNTLDSTYFTLWSDPDLGDAFDDYVGCDTTSDYRGKPHNLGYAYNGTNTDGPIGYGTAPPAVGFKLMQGPLIQGSFNDTAIAFGKKWAGFKNGRISSFNFYCGPGQGGCTNPDWYDPSLFGQTYNIMKGLTRTGKPQIDCNGDTTKFVFAGDPVTGTGCLNSHLLQPSDIRFTMPTGPLTLAPGDSQEVIYAVIIDRGANNLNSITRLRILSERVNLAYENSFKNIPFASLLSPNIYSPPFLINAFVKDAIQVVATLTSQTGTILGTATLYDDGLHNDSSANDNIWGNWLHSNVDSAGAMLSLSITYSNNQTLEWRNLLTGIPTIGKIKIDDFQISADHINNDGIPNPGENIRFTLKLINFTNFNLNIWNINEYKVESPHISQVNLPRSSVVNIPSNSISNWFPDNYYSLNIDKNTPTPHIAKIIFQFNDDKENYWFDTLKFTVQEFTFPPIDTLPLHSSGYSEGTFRICLVDYSQLKDNYYKININKPSQDNITFNLINTQTNDSLLKKHELPEPLYGHNIPVTDGFRIRRGNFTTLSGAKKWDYLPLSNKWFTGVNGYSTRMDVLCGYRGFITYPRIGRFVDLVSSVPADSLRIVELRFSDNNTQKAYRCIDGLSIRPPRGIIHPEFRPFVITDSVGYGYWYQDYEMYPLGNSALGRTVPFTVWEINNKTGQERQLDVAIIERNDTLYRKILGSDGNDSLVYIYRGNIDGKWNPSPLNNSDSQPGDEVILILNTTYSDSPKTDYTVQGNWYSRQYQYKYAVWMRRMNVGSTYTDGDVLEITPYFPLTANDVFEFNPLKLLSVKNTKEVPDRFALYNNYPNPFNPQTTIRYEIPVGGRVVLEIYNLLGQKVRTLLNEEKPAGRYSSVWDGKNDNGNFISSGVYLYRLVVSSSGPLRSENYTTTKKMVLIR
ncbi:MAG: FlgD immunoglobulin-like domain containing protein [Bacteroidota bacterium]|nr:FlgD immunoglobulin-like domain containing protein [Bacteroidota bacterium]